MLAESQMVINYVPGEECRVAIVEDGKLEELYVERFATASRVGNIYVGRVMNVEPSIQAAFVDFGVGENGFLHVSDLHPRYFPGQDDETTERVGFKTPRRERPPIQAALRRGDEVIVQVLKEGVGTKGPTVTSYLSIPGRFLVMMPGMDNIGVSRKVEDEDLRRKMRDILDQLELPENFGFILRTAGMDRTKTELKRDLAYLQRLWKDMERRLKAGGGKEKTRLLYSESDLLVRSLRDLLTSDISEVVIDHEAALKRASRFMKIVAPRGSAKLMQMPDSAPIFHAFGIEKQIHLIHAREVPLPSGGRLVIDQTEALVAIDVNSGKSRDSRNSEDNAYQTNLEAVDEICRQLRLRDMGGIVINDLIDMRHMSNRRDIENRFKERLKRDRARSTILAISEFGILEMTRQRMRPSHESVHFSDCPLCRGRGMVQKPDSVAAEAMRDLCVVLDMPRVKKVEMVVAPRVAGDLLSTKRQMISRVERQYGKHVDVRVSETVSVDRVSFYAYDELGQDLELGELPIGKRPKELKPWVDPEDAGTDWADNESEATIPEPITAEEAVDDFAAHPIELDDPSLEEDEGGGQHAGNQGDPGQRRTGQRGAAQRGTGQRGTGQRGAGQRGPQGVVPNAGGPSGVGAVGGEGTDEGGRKRRRRRGRRSRGGSDGGPSEAAGQQQPPQQQQPQQPARNSGPAHGEPQSGPTHAPQRGSGGAGAPSEHAHQRGGGPMRTTPGGRPIIVGDHGDEEVDGPVAGADDGSTENLAGGPAGEPVGMDGDPRSMGAEDGQESPDGEGGRRRRRRRRRGGRGRGNGPEGDFVDGVASPGGPVDAAGVSPIADAAAADAFARSVERGAGAPGPEDDGPGQPGGAGNRTSEAEFVGDGNDPNGGGEHDGDGRGGDRVAGEPDSGEPAPGDGGPRRRRRRRGRGGRSGGGDVDGGPVNPGGESAGPVAPQRAPERPQTEGRSGGRGDRGGAARGTSGRDEGARDQRPPSDGRRSDGGSMPMPPAAPSAPAARPAATPPGASAAGKPAQPRTLYGATKRKLSASELNRRPKAE